MSDRNCPICALPSFRTLFEHRDRLHGLGGVFTIVRCERCGLWSYEPFPDEATLASYYPTDYYAHRPGEGGEAPGRWRRLLDDLHLGLRRGPLLRILLAPLLWYKEVYSYARFLRPVTRGRLLDVGCGDGAFLLKARRMGFECHGLEPGGRPGGALAGEGISVATCPLDELEGRDRFFDVITLNHVFEHLINPEGALRKLRVLLAPGGRLLIRIPNADHCLLRRCPRHWLPLDTPRHVYLYDRVNFKTLAGRNGLQVESVTTECMPTNYQMMLKSALFGHRFDRPHWIDSPVISMAMLPMCDVLNWVGQGECLAMWLSIESNERGA